MEILEKLRQFLLGFPGLEDLSADFTQDGPGNSGLFPGGLTEVERRKDLLGNTYVTYECLFTLYKRLEPGQDSAQWLLDFQSWLAERTDAVLVRKAKTQEASRLQCNLCTVTLAVRLQKTFDAKEVSYADNCVIYH